MNHTESTELSTAGEPSARLPFDYQILDRDDRVRIRRVKLPPWAWICKIEAEYVHPKTRRKRRTISTGALVAPNKVLTAAHAVFDRRQGYGRAKRIRVIPGKRGRSTSRLSEPFGSASAKRVDIPVAYSSSRSTRDQARAADYAVITLRTSFRRPKGFFRYAILPSRLLLGKRFTTAGYPGDKGGSQQWGMTERVVSVSSSFLEYVHDTVPGQSGSPVWFKRNGRRYVVGVHTRRDDPATPAKANVGVRINSAVAAQIRTWIRRP